MMRRDIPYAGHDIVDPNMVEFVRTLTQEELATHARSMYRWEMWYHSMEWE
jgi:hypothetical protein